MLAYLLLFTLASASPAAEPMIFDTDSAFFNDDGAALAMLLARPDKVEVLGVTVVSGNEWLKQGSEYLLSLLESSGHGNIPLYLGADKPLKHSPEKAASFKEAYGTGYMGAFDKKKEFLDPPFGGKLATKRPEKESAVSFLIETIRKRPGEVTVFAAGPMTNLALAFRKAPDLPKKIKRLVFMGGAAQVPGNTTPAAELNIWFDPEAAADTLSADIPSKVMFPLDVTNKVKLTEERLAKMQRTPLVEQLRADMKRFPGFFTEQRVRDWSYLWDCLPAAYLIDSSLFGEPKTGQLIVDTNWGPGYGRTDVSFKQTGKKRRPVDVVFDVDAEGVLQLLEASISRAPSK
jgi:inosine-uridine nucleoside N-ribohydrolase